MTYRGPGVLGDYVRAPAKSCVSGGCQYTVSRQLLGQMSDALNQMGKSGMSSALWCDSGGHAFSERDPGRQRISITVLDEESGEEKMEARDFCGECAEAAGLLNKRRTRPVQIPHAIEGQTAEPRRADPQRIHQLEDELGMTPSA